MDIIIDNENNKNTKSQSLNNNNKNNDMNMMNNNPMTKDINDQSEDFISDNNPDLPSALDNTSQTSEIFGSSSTGEPIYEFGNSSHIVSEKVQNLAPQIYNELQKIINRFNDDEESVGGLMPLIVDVLESLEIALLDNQQLQVDLELCKDDNEKLVQAFEKEKQHKKKIEQRLFEYELSTEDEKQHYQEKIDSLSSIVKMLELKTKNVSDHSTRLEEKESEMKKEYAKLHERYNELLRSHCDLMERAQNSSAFNKNNSNKYSTDNNDNYGLMSGITINDVGSATDLTSPIQPRQNWIETEMSYDDTTTIIEDVEELQKDDKDTREQSLSDNFFGMEKEIQNLINENNDLLATKNALNIVKDDLIVQVDELTSQLIMCKNEIQQKEAVQERLKNRISQLEDELKKSKDELEESKQKLASLKEDEEGVPLAQRKRFTRVEMSRVLMERNSYKEKYFELQEALKWSELSRASKAEDKRSTIWKILSNIFNPSPTTGTIDQPRNSPVQSATPAIRYSTATTSNPTATPALEAMRRRARGQPNGDLELMLDSDLSSERARAMKNLKAHVPRSGSGDHIQAYGWSIMGNNDTNNKTTTKTASVPVPIYCRPLGGEDIGMKIWCATAVDLSGGEAGFSETKSTESETTNKDDNQQQQQTSQDSDLTDLENEIDEALKEQLVPNDQQYSNFVWICSVSHSKSKVTIVNIRSNPGEVLDSFFIKTHLLCIESTPGAKTSDFLGNSSITINEETSPELKLSHRKEKPMNDVATSITFSSPVPSIHSDVSTNDNQSINNENDNIKTVEEISTSTSPTTVLPAVVATEATGQNVTLEKLTEYVAYTQPPSPTISSSDVKESVSQEKSTPHPTLPIQAMSTRLPTMWLGGQNGVLYVHSAIAQWSHCIATVHLPDSILHIVHYRGRVFVALANGQCCIFFRCEQTGEWNFNQYYTLDIGVYSSILDNAPINSNDAVTPDSSNANQKNPTPIALYSIRCLEIVKDAVWFGYRNLIFIVNTRTFKVMNSFVAHPRKETYVRQLASLGDGVWCSFRLDSTLRLYSAFKPYQHIQTIDIEPYVTKMVTPKSFNFVRITALKASNNRLWIGTSNGVILCLPCVCPEEDDSKPNIATLSKKVTTNEATGSLTLSTFMPLCDVSHIQLSFHGHKDNIKFFVCTNNLILSGGEGYIDFRINHTNETTTSLSKGDRSHLIVWEITT